MNAQNDQTPIDVLDLATAALREAAPAGGPSPALVASTIEALQALSAHRKVVLHDDQKWFLPRMVRYGSLAAAAAVVLVASSLWLLDRTATTTFAQMVDNVRKAKSVSFVLKQKLGDQPLLVTEMAIQGDRLRYVLADSLALIIDLKDRKELQLDLHQKIADRIDLKERVPVEMFRDPIERLRNLKDDIQGNVEKLGDEELDGHNCHVFQVKGRPEKPAVWLVPDSFKLWVDAKTGLPVRILAEDERTSLTYERFVWDEPLREQLFSIEAPDGYRLRKLEAAVIKPDRVYFNRPSLQLDSMQPDGKNVQSDFVPQLLPLPNTYVSEKTEMSPDGRYLAMAFTNTTDHGSFPPDRIFLWDRTHPEQAAIAIQFPVTTELNSWQFSPDGKRLYVNWWAPSRDQKQSEGRTGADWVDLKDKSRHSVKLPTFRDSDGQERVMGLAAVTRDGQTYLLIGQGLHVATVDGKMLRRLTAASDRIMLGSVRLSPDDKQVLYVTFHPEDRSQELNVVSLSGDATKRLTPSGRFSVIRPRWSPDGRRIAYTCRSLDPGNPPLNFGTEMHLRLVDPDGENVVTLLTEKVYPRGDGIELMAWR